MACDPGNQFTTTRPGYDVKQVDAFLDKAEPRLAAIRRNDPVSGTILTDWPTGQTQQGFQPPPWAEWAGWADSTRFLTITKGSGYDTAEVDAFRQEIRDTFLGIKQPPLTSDEANDKRFRMARRRGYDVPRSTPSAMKPYRGWLRCNAATSDGPDSRRPDGSRDKARYDSKYGTPAERGSRR